MGAYVCIAMLEDPPYSIYLAATEEEPEDWCAGLPLPSHLLCYEKFNDPEDFVQQYAKALLVCAIRVLEGKAFPAPAHEVIRCFMKVRDKVVLDGGVAHTFSRKSIRPESGTRADLAEELKALPWNAQDEGRRPMANFDIHDVKVTVAAEEYPEEAIDYDIFEFTAHEDHAVLTRYIGFDDALISIPCHWHGLPVTTIGERAFSKATNLCEINIGHGIEIIETSAFEDCRNLRTVKLPDTLKHIGKGCFKDCIFLTINTIPNSVISIGQSSFKNCNSLRNITIPDSVNNIGQGAFYSCNGLRKAALPKGLMEIPANAFNGCRSLAAVDFPSQLALVGEEAFKGCYALDKVVLNEGVKAICSEAFAFCDSLMEAHIPSSVTKLGNKIFYSSSRVTVFCKPGSATHIYCRENQVKCAKAQ